jgi:hypothetical protein
MPLNTGAWAAATMGALLLGLLVRQLIRPRGRRSPGDQP